MSVRVSVVIPAYREGKDIVPVMDRILESVESDCEILVVVDTDDDPTLPIIVEYSGRHSKVRGLVNTYGRGPANAIRFGIDSASSPIVVVTMADGSDDPRQIDSLARLVDRGVAVASASRYMAGGQQVGGPMLKGFLSRAAGTSLHVLARVGTKDATNSFKAYSTEFVKEVGIHSRVGFEIGIELTAKARRLRLPIGEVPTIWLDRTTGQSNFKLGEALPNYLRWYRFAFGRRMTTEELRRAAEELTNGQVDEIRAEFQS